MKNFLILTTFLLTVFYNADRARAYSGPAVRPTVADSIGVEKTNGKRFILHRVDQGQTLFAIARRYGRSVAEIKAANPAMSESVRYAQVVRIPIPEGSISRREEKAIDKAIRKEEKEQKKIARAEPKPNDKLVIDQSGAKPEKESEKESVISADAGIHVVKPGQTLYSLAVRYGIPQADLRRWNNLSSNNVLIGQALIVSEKAYQARVPASMPAVSVRTPDTPARAAVPSANDSRPVESRPTESRPAPTRRTEEPKPERPAPVTDNRRPEPTAPAGSKPAEPEVEVESPRPGNDAPMPTRGRRVSTSGVAEMIEGTDGSGKYLALHRTAPIGTLVQVRNEFNNQSLWVKVIGRLPNTGVNDKILIKLSTQAFAKLSPQDRRFRAEVSYIVR